MEPELTLDKAKYLICQREAVKEQQEVLKEPIKEDSLLHAKETTSQKKVIISSSNIRLINTP